MRATVRIVAAALGALLVAGCQPSGVATSPPAGTAAAVTCEDLPVLIVDAIQSYVDSFGGTAAAAVAGAVTARQADFTAVTSDLRSQAEELGCDPDELAAGIRGELGRLEGGSPVQDAIAGTFRAGPLGTTDPSDLGAVQVTVASAEELVAALALAGSGSVIRIAAGEYRLTQPLVVLRPVTLVGEGSGPGGTILTSTAAEGALVISTSGDAVVRDLAIRHTGAGAGSVVLVAGGGYVLERLRVEGGVAAAGGGGYGVVLRPAANPILPSGTRQELTDVELVGNPAGGVVVAGAEEPTVTGVAVEGSGGCGLCFIEQGAGTAVDSTVTGSQVGVRVDDDAAPTVTGLTVVGAQVGVALTGSGAARIVDATLTGNATGIQVTGGGPAVLIRPTIVDSLDVGIRVSGSARATLQDPDMTGGTTVGVAVVGEATPRIAGGRIATTGEVGMIWAETAAGTATGITIAGPRLALQLSDDASPVLDGIAVEAASAGSLLANGRSGGTVSALVCAPGDGAVVALAEQTTVAVTGTGCQIADER